MAVTHPTWLNRKQRKDLARRPQSADPGLDVIHPNAAGIDVGNSTHYVAVRPDRDPDPVRRFDCFTADLDRLADWLQHCGVTTVALQSTGVYWIPLYEILDARGLDVYLVNARHTKNLPGRKTDVQESQWLMKLHRYGLLRNSFHPATEIRVCRTYWRQRGDHVHAISTCIQRMQKALTQMNIQLAKVISDLSGWTGMRIVRAILAGERDPQALAALRHPGIHATRDVIAKSLEGTWQADLLFVLQQEVTLYDVYQQRITECDHALQAHLKAFADRSPDGLAAGHALTPIAGARRRSGPPRRRKAGSHAPQFDLGRELHRISGVDLTRIDGIDVGVAQTLISEVGLDMARWPDEHHFASWLGLCPDNRITGGKVIRHGTRPVINRAATALRIGATTLLRSQSYLGAQYRRLRGKLGAPKAITAMAHKLAVLVYRLLRWGHEYVDKGMQYYEERHREHQIRRLTKRAATLGLVVVAPAIS
jgi:transposase